MSQTDQILDVLRGVLASYSADIPVSAESLASEAIKQLDPQDVSAPLVAWGCLLELRQLSRGLLRKTYENNKDDDPQATLFEDLQDRYPGVGSHAGLYMPRMQMSLEDRLSNISRLRKEAEAKLEHADKLEAETEQLVADGFFSQLA